MFELNYQQRAKEMQDFIKRTVAEAGFTKVILAVSGGVDSAVSLFLAVKALGADNVYAVLLPYGKLSQQSLQHGQMVVAAAGLSQDHVFVRDISTGVDTFLEQAENPDDVRRGNIMARSRMIVVFDLAKQLHALVVGTENKSEHYLGYFTRFGDEASDIEPIRSLYKTQVWEMAKYLGVPVEIIGKKPSAGLWENQSDEGEFGFSYLDADKVLYHHFEENLPREAIIDLGINAQLVDSVLSFAQKNDFKHKVPYVFEN